MGALGTKRVILVRPDTDHDLHLFQSSPFVSKITVLVCINILDGRVCYTRTRIDQGTQKRYPADGRSGHSTARRPVTAGPLPVGRERELSTTGASRQGVS